MQRSCIKWRLARRRRARSAGRWLSGCSKPTRWLQLSSLQFSHRGSVVAVQSLRFSRRGPLSPIRTRVKGRQQLGQASLPTATRCATVYNMSSSALQLCRAARAGAPSGHQCRHGKASLPVKVLSSELPHHLQEGVRSPARSRLVEVYGHTCVVRHCLRCPRRGS